MTRAVLLDSGLGHGSIVVATTNIGHLSRFVPAEFWQNISA